jgi:CheY-like chemotaxis protein
VRIDSAPGAGTTVRLYLPRSGAGLDARGTPKTAGEALPTGRERVLLVEDNEQIRALATGILRGLGYRVTVTENADAALVHLQRGERFDLLFSDIVMPGRLNGIGLAAALRAQDPSARVLFTSGFSSPAPLREQMQVFGARLIAKPYRKADLARQVRDLLNQAVEAVA